MNHKKHTNKSFLLIHGAFHGAWCWKEVKTLLEEKCQTVYTPDLPGLGNDNTPRDNIDLNTHSQFIIDYIKQKNLQDLILVGHSYAGAIIEHIYPDIKAHIAETVFLSALVLEDQQSVFDFMSKKKSNKYKSLAEQSNDNSIKVSFETARRAFLEYNSDKSAQELYNMLSPQPVKTYETKVNALEFLNSNIAKTFIYCTKDRIVKPSQQDIFIERLGTQTKTIKIDTGHNPMISHPKLLVEVLTNLQTI